jgi:two-component system NtrC family sensor kinase
MKKIFIISSILLLLIKVNAQDNTTDSLKQLLSVAKEDTNKVQILFNLGWAYQWNKPDSAIMYGLKARELSQQLNYIDGEIEVAPVLSEALCAKGNFSQALEIDLQAKQLAEKNGKQTLFSESWIGNIYFYSGDYTKALEYYLKYRSDSGEKTRGVIGETYYHLGRLDSAFFYINKAYQIDKNSSIGHWSVPYYYLALINAKEGKFKDALDNYRLGLLYSRNINQDIANGYNGIAVVFKQMGQVDSAIYYAKEAMKLAQKESLTPSVLDASALLTELYIKINTDSAFKYQRVMLATKDSLFSEEKIKQMQNLSFNEQMRQQELQQTIQQTQLKYRNRLNVYILLAGLLIVLIVALGLWRRNIYKQKSYALLHKQKEQIESTLTQLKDTQSQLIQSEKMASLGELTAGIAHEIQNPLNFVNNFSEVNKELLQELKDEADKGNINEVKAIANDVIDNEEKINHHGKRADSIVKGMLQHSRSGTGVKEPTDINALADEYLRLSYHGLRAKDNSFNATIKTDFDESTGNINIIPQDIGRVLLNLYNNAFYAVNEKQNAERLKQNAEYHPTVSVQTKKINDKVVLTVMDNGNGIPQKVVDKIFQPFFTTKPTGQGTGLGLSLSYDIIKAHSGVIKAETKESEGTTFIIKLPVV